MNLNKGAKPQIDAKGEFLAELIEKRNYWYGRTLPGEHFHDDHIEFSKAYERLIIAFTAPKE